MDKEPFDHIDNWFRQAADLPGPSMPANAWQEMELLLDRQEKRRRFFLFWWWWAGVSIIGAMVFLLNIGEAAEQPTLNHPEATTTIAANTKTENKPRISKKNLSVTEPVLAKDNSGPSENTSGLKSNELSGLSTDKNSVSKDKQLLTSIKRKISSGTGKTILSKNQANNKNSRHRSSTGSDQKPASDNLMDLFPFWTNHATPRSSWAIEMTKTEKQAEKLMKKKLTDETGNATAKAADKIKLSRPGRFFVFGAAGLERSFVPSNDIGSSAFIGTIGAGYQLSNRWYLQTGIALTRKKYIAKGSDYHPAKGSYYDSPNITLNEVDADCRLLEWHLQLRYDLLQSRKSNLFAAAGIVSSQMRSEAYGYDYTKNGDWYYANHRYSTGKFKFANAATVTVGYEHAINKKIKLMLMPSLTIPMQGVGEGKVKIGAVNIQAGIRYQLPF